MNAARMQALWAKMPLAEAVVQALGWVGNAERLQAIFAAHRGRCYDKQIRFPDLVTLVGQALLEHGGSGHQSFTRGQESGVLEASLVAAYGKLGRLPVPLSQPFLTELSQSLRALFPAAAARTPPASLRGLNTIALDGKAIKRVAKRLQPLRKLAGGLLGGRALVALHYETGFVLALHADEDGDANEVRFVPELLPVVRAQLPGPLLFLADSGFCDLQRFAEFTADSGHFLVRRHPKVGWHPDPLRAAQTGTDAQGRVYQEAWGWLGAAAHPQRRYVRQITLHRSGEKDVTLVTDLLDPEQTPAEELLQHYLTRWQIEQVFQKVTEVFHLQALIGSTPKATIFQFAFCLLLYNLVQLLRGCLAAEHRRAADSISLENLFYDVQRQLTAWSVLTEAGLPLKLSLAPRASALKQRLSTLLGAQWSDRWIKSVNQKRRAHQAKPHERTHHSVFRALQIAAAAKQ